MQSVVLDSNVFVAAGFKPRSHSARILQAVAAGRLRLVWNDAVRREILATVNRIPHLRNQGQEKYFQPKGEFRGSVTTKAFDHITDPDDRKFAALAVAAGTVIVSSDRHLLDHRHRREPSVHTPGEFVKNCLEEPSPLGSPPEGDGKTP